MNKATASASFSGPVAFVVVAILLGLRLMSIGEVDDPGLKEAIKAELRNDLGQLLSRELNKPTDSPEAIQALADLADESSIKIYSAKVSKPLLSMGSKTGAVVRIDYQLGDEPRETVYWLFDHSAIGGWRYKYPTTRIGYYLNFF